MQRYYLMNKDKKVAAIDVSELFSGAYRFDVTEQYDSYMPCNYTGRIEAWIDERQAAKHHKAVKAMMIEAGIFDHKGFIDMTRCLSLTDTFWIKSETSEDTWDSVSLYTNDFNEVISHIAFDGAGLYGRQLEKTSPELTTDGQFPKCWIRDEQGIYLLKRGTDGEASAGMEPYCEALSSQLLASTGMNSVRYDLVKYHKRVASKCELFTSEAYGFVNYISANQGKNALSDVMDFYMGTPMEEQFREMVVFDAVTVNTDRHPGNFGVIVDNDNGDIVRMAPVFDMNLSNLPGLMEGDDFEQYYKEFARPSSIGNDFITAAQAMLTSDIRAKLIALKDFKYEDPGCDCPAWKIDSVNRIKDRQINAILNVGPTFSFMKQDEDTEGVLC